jgi:hypothetical protein
LSFTRTRACFNGMGEAQEPASARGSRLRYRRRGSFLPKFRARL